MKSFDFNILPVILLLRSNLSFCGKNAHMRFPLQLHPTASAVQYPLLRVHTCGKPPHLQLMLTESSCSFVDLPRTSGCASMHLHLLLRTTLHSPQSASADIPWFFPRCFCDCLAAPTASHMRPIPPHMRLQQNPYTLINALSLKFYSLTI